MIPGRQYSAADVLQMAWRRGVVMCAVFVLAAVAAVEGVRWLPSSYRSEALILIDAARVSEDVVQQSVSVLPEAQLRSLSQQVLSRTTLEQVIQEFGLYRQSPAGVSDDALEDMREDAKVEMVKSDAFRVSYVASEPHLAQRVTARLAQIIVDDYARQRTDFAVDVNQFLDSQLAQARTALEEQEARLDAYRQSHIGELPTDLQANMVALSAAQIQAQAMSESLVRDAERLEMLRSTARNVAAPPGVAPPADPLVQQLTTARAELAALLTRVQPGHPDAVRLERTVRELESALAARASTPQRPAAADTEPTAQAATLEIEVLAKRISARTTEHDRLLRSIGKLTGRVTAAPGHEAEMATLTRDYDLLQKQYAVLTTKAEESRIASSLEQRHANQRFRLIDPALVPDRPLGPRRVRLTLFGLLGACALALGIGLALEMRDTSMHDRQDVSAGLDLPLLGVITEIDSSGHRLRHALLWVVGLVVSASGLLLAAWSVR